jgi:phosphate transport system permease protein
MQVKGLQSRAIGLFDVCIWLFSILTCFIFAAIVGDIIVSGIGTINWQFISSAPTQAGRSGGIWPIIVSTLLILLICMGVSIPLGFATAILLSEFTREEHYFARFIRRSLNILAGVPSIVFGLFGNAFFCKFLGFGFSILSGGLTLACMVLPILVKSTEESLLAVPSDYRLQRLVFLGLAQLFI